MSQIMSPITRVLLASILLVILAAAPSIEGSSGGKQNQASGCSCHSNGANGITANHNFPTSYTPATTYSITVDGNGGSQAFSGGFSLQVDKGTFSNAGTLVQFSGGTSATHTGSGSLSWTMDWTAPASGSGTVNVALAVLQANANTLNSGDSWDTTTATVTETVQQNQAPTALNLRLMPGGDTPVNEDIMFAYIFNDADGDSESNSQIRWSKNGALVSTYNDMINLPSSATSVGDTWTVSVTPNDGQDLGATEVCPDSAVIIDGDSDGDGPEI